MSEFHLAFTPDLTSISAPDGRVTLREEPVPTAFVKANDAEAIATLHSIAGKLNELERLLELRINDLQQQIASLAFDVARAVLNDEETLIHRRVQNYVQIAVDQLEPTVPKTMYVHPTCLNTIAQWLQQTDHEEIEIKEDASISPGDCRIESGETGVAATLDAFLELLFKQLTAEGTRDDS